MSELADIRHPVTDFVERFHKEFDDALQSQSQWVRQAIRHLKQTNGKQIRPLLVGLMTRLCGEEPQAASCEAAVLLELIHTATLIHDDVIDKSDIRRGCPTLNAVFDNRVAVLIGDFILSSALMRAVRLSDLRIIAIITSLGRDLSEGEIRQMETAEKVILDEHIYMEVIRQKTASLFRASGEIAAITAGTDDSVVARCGEIGELVGYAFQIRDDIFDYYSDNVGKPTGNDIREGKVTLPLLYALENTEKSERESCLEILRKKNFSDENVTRLIHLAVNKGGIHYAEKRMTELIGRANSALASFPPSSARDSLSRLFTYIAARKK